MSDHISINKTLLDDIQKAAKDLRLHFTIKSVDGPTTVSIGPDQLTVFPAHFDAAQG